MMKMMMMIWISDVSWILHKANYWNTISFFFLSDSDSFFCRRHESIPRLDLHQIMAKVEWIFVNFLRFWRNASIIKTDVHLGFEYSSYLNEASQLEASEI